MNPFPDFQDVKERRGALRCAASLRHCPSATLDLLAETLRPQRLAAGEALFARDDPPTAVFLLAQGELRVQPERGGGVRVQPGTWVGEFGVLLDRRRTATVRAVADSVVLAISAEAFLALIRETPDLAVQLWAQTIRRLLDVESRLPEASAAS